MKNEAKKMIDSGLLHVKGFFIGIEYVLLATFVLSAAGFDIKQRRIPNFLIITGILTSLVYQTLSGYGYGFFFWATGLAVGLLLLLPLYIFRAMGAGDVKLMALVGSFLGAAGVSQTTILTFAAGGILALTAVFLNNSWKLVLYNIRLITTNLVLSAMSGQLPKAELPAQSAGNLPYGVAIAAGTLLYICFFRS